MPLRTVERNEDMSSSGKLRLHQQGDGDVIVAIIPDPEEERRGRNSVEFCAIGCGGGRSPKTLAALRNLITAMEEDNKERPIKENK